jgi:hypothetical protein
LPRALSQKRGNTLGHSQHKTLLHFHADRGSVDVKHDRSSSSIHYSPFYITFVEPLPSLLPCRRRQLACCPDSALHSTPSPHHVLSTGASVHHGRLPHVSRHQRDTNIGYNERTTCYQSTFRAHFQTGTLQCLDHLYHLRQLLFDPVLRPRRLLAQESLWQPIHTDERDSKERVRQSSYRWGDEVVDPGSGGISLHRCGFWDSYLQVLVCRFETCHPG